MNVVKRLTPYSGLKVLISGGAAGIGEVIAAAYLEIGAIDPLEPLTAENSAIGLSRLQDQIDAWGADRLTIAVQDRVTYTLPSGTNTVTIGPTLDAVPFVSPAWSFSTSFGVSPNRVQRSSG